MPLRLVRTPLTLEDARSFEECTCRKPIIGSGCRFKTGIIEKVYRGRKDGRLRAKVTWGGRITYELLDDLTVF